MKRFNFSIIGPGDDDADFVPDMLIEIAGEVSKGATSGVIASLNVEGKQDNYKWAFTQIEKPVPAAEPGPEMNITIAAGHNTGKSAVAMMLGRALIEAGVQTVKLQSEDTKIEILAADYRERLATFAAKNPQVTIDMVQLPRKAV